MLQISILGQVVAKMDYLSVPSLGLVLAHYGQSGSATQKGVICKYKPQHARNGMRLSVSSSMPKKLAVGKLFWIRTAGRANASRRQKGSLCAIPEVARLGKDIEPFIAACAIMLKFQWVALTW